MDCQQALNELGRLIDGELPSDERLALETHLLGCGDCRAACDGLRVSDAELLRAFMPRREAATLLADRVIDQLRGERTTRVAWRALAVPLVAAAAGFLLAVIVLRPSVERSRAPVGAGAAPLARLSLATGPTEVRTPRQIDWLVCPVSGPIDAGASVRTAADARCELQASDGTQIRLDKSTEIEMPKPRSVRMTRGELYSCVSPDGGPFQVETPDATVESAQGKFDFACSPGQASLTVLEGSASVECKSGTRRVEQGESVRLIDGRWEDTAPMGDPLQATAWVNELLLMKGVDNPEWTERLNDILAQIGQTKVSYLYEDEIRRLGSRAALPLLRYIESPRSQENEARRISAARLATDLADSSVVGDLIRLLADDNPRVRVYVAQALQRLTGENQGRPPAAWEESLASCQPTLEAWDAWWRKRGEQ